MKQLLIKDTGNTLQIKNSVFWLLLEEFPINVNQLPRHTERNINVTEQKLCFATYTRVKI